MPRYANHGFTRTSVTIGPIAITAGTSQQVIALSLPVPARRVLESLVALPTVAATGAGASRVLSVRKGNASGTAILTATLALADLNTIGTPKAYAANTSGANLEDGDTYSIEIASGGTQFTAGTFILLLTFREQPQRIA
jgi:hypothetical protein